MKKFLVLCFIFCIMASSANAAKYVKIEPQFLQASQSKSFEQVNQTLAIIFSKIKPQIKTEKYPKYYHDFTIVKDDGTQNKAYKYVKYGNAELIYKDDSNELKYVSFRRPELMKCRIIYDYPSGSLHAVQVFVSDTESFVYSADGKYVDYSPYVKEVREKVIKKWTVPARKEIEKQANGQKDLLVQMAITVEKSGNVKKCTILKSSKIKLLEDNALAAVKLAAPFKQFPENFFNEELVIILNFNYSL